MKINGPIFNYHQYLVWMASVVNYPSDNSEKAQLYSQYTFLNIQRVKRLNKTIQIDERFLNIISKRQKWIIIAEPWCGDCAQIIPFFGKLSELHKNTIDLQIILRDENPDWISKYHTNGSWSIPKLIVFDENDNELFIWGPRPKPAQELFLNWKNNKSNKSWEQFETDLHTWYANDKTKTLQNEIYELLSSIK
ncbi:MAG: hypothetical protein OHK0036_04370 [Bacteroidia bacterium]